MWRFGLNHYLFQSYLKFKGPNFLPCCLQEFSSRNRIILPYCWVISCWDGFWSAGSCFSISFGRENTFFCLGSKIFPREIPSWTKLWAKWKGWKLSYFLLLSYIQLIELSNQTCALYKRENEPDVSIFSLAIFCSPELTQLSQLSSSLQVRHSLLCPKWSSMS